MTMIMPVALVANIAHRMLAILCILIGAIFRYLLPIKKCCLVDWQSTTWAFAAV